jgi:hypothetical protein
MAVRLRRPKIPAVTLGTRCRHKARIQARIRATEHQLNRLVRRHMQGIRCQLKPSLLLPVLANLRRQRMQVIKWHQLQNRTRTRVIKWRRCRSLTRTLGTRWARKRKGLLLHAQALQRLLRMRPHTNSISNKQKRRRNEAYRIHTTPQDFQSFTGYIGSSRMLDAV